MVWGSAAGRERTVHRSRMAGDGTAGPAVGGAVPEASARPPAPLCLSMDSDTETPRKGPLAPAGEVVKSSLSPRPDSDAGVGPRTPRRGDAATRGGGGGGGAVAPARAAETPDEEPAAALSQTRSPPKSLMLSQTQHYESPSRRRLAQGQAGGGLPDSQRPGGESQSTLVYAAGSAGAESQRTLLYTEPQQLTPAGGPASRDDAPSLRPCGGGAGRTEAASGEQEWAENGAPTDGTRGGAQSPARSTDNPCYRALPDMPSQLTPASQGLSVASQTQQRYTQLSTFGPEMLHERAPSGSTGRACSTRSGLRSCDPEHSHESGPTALRREGQHSPEQMPGAGAEAGGHTDLSTGSSTEAESQRSQSPPGTCMLSITEQGAHGSLRPSQSQNASAGGEGVRAVGAQGAAQAPHTPPTIPAAVLPRTGGGRAEQLRREKAMVHEISAPDDLMSQDVRFAVPAQRNAAAIETEGAAGKSCHLDRAKIMQTGPDTRSEGISAVAANGGDDAPKADTHKDAPTAHSVTPTKQARQSAEACLPAKERCAAEDVREAHATGGGAAGKTGSESAHSAARSAVKHGTKAAQDVRSSEDDSALSAKVGHQPSEAPEVRQELQVPGASGSQASEQQQQQGTGAKCVADNVEHGIAADSGQSGSSPCQHSPARSQMTDAALHDETLDEVSQESPVSVAPPPPLLYIHP